MSVELITEHTISWVVVDEILQTREDIDRLIECLLVLKLRMPRQLSAQELFDNGAIFSS